MNVTLGALKASLQFETDERNESADIRGRLWPRSRGERGDGSMMNSNHASNNEPQS